MIISNPACSPFVLVCSEVNDGCSISFIDVVPRSSELRTLLPLIAFSPIRKFSSAQPPCSEINSAASVSCSGLLIHVTSLVLGTGPLLSPQDTFDRTESSRTDSTHMEQGVWTQQRRIPRLLERLPSPLCRLLQQNHPEINGIVQNHITFSRCSVFQPVSASYSSWTAAVLL
ncbi:hypothetical protein BLNAU_19058 [Blattamonas nauphoetae]|uniref:Uncharacterized protein n=1 Tax=Blattamonas nauphoetae TaxID=2049346 RepID=A0ABQ9X2R5_9EUKA|nr:hypothetical protein BLNAU_19058 [Blattamonas nauphoetae]